MEPRQLKCHSAHHERRRYVGFFSSEAGTSYDCDKDDYMQVGAMFIPGGERASLLPRRRCHHVVVRRLADAGNLGWLSRLALHYAVSVLAPLMRADTKPVGTRSRARVVVLGVACHPSVLVAKLWLVTARSGGPCR